MSFFYIINIICLHDNCLLLRIAPSVDLHRYSKHGNRQRTQSKKIQE